MLSYRLYTEPEAGELIAGLNVYAEEPHAFDDTAAEIGKLHDVASLVGETGTLPREGSTGRVR